MPVRVCVAVFALTMLSLGPALFLAVHGSLFRHWQDSAVRNQNGGLVCNMLNIFSRACEPILYSVGELQIGAIICGSLVWVLVLVHLLVSIHEVRAEKGGLGRAYPRRLTVTISNVEKGYRRTREHERRGTRDQAGRNNHRQRGTEPHYPILSLDGNSDTAPTFYVRKPSAAYSSRSHRCR